MGGQSVTTCIYCFYGPLKRHNILFFIPWSTRGCRILLCLLKNVVGHLYFSPGCLEGIAYWIYHITGPLRCCKLSLLFIWFPEMLKKVQSYGFLCRRHKISFFSLKQGTAQSIVILMLSIAKMHLCEEFVPNLMKQPISTFSNTFHFQMSGKCHNKSLIITNLLYGSLGSWNSNLGQTFTNSFNVGPWSINMGSTVTNSLYAFLGKQQGANSY